MSFLLGPYRLQNPFILAPMAGITNSPYRRLMRHRGSALVVSELVSANGLDYSSKKTLELMSFHEEERRVGLQVFGERREALVRACRKVEALGADFVDLNLGCPVNKIVKKGAGSAMCRDPLELSRVLSLMVNSVKIPVTIKIRLGWNSEEKNALEVVRAAEDVGVAWVAIHGRTRSQAYTGEADWDFIGNIKSKVSIPIIGNGDIVTPELAVERYRRFGVDAVMIGRGALRNPFIFEQSEQFLKTGAYTAASAEDYLKLLQDQKYFLSFHPNERTALLQSKKFLAWYSAGFPRCHDFRRQIFEIKDFESAWEFGLEFFTRSLPERDMSFLNESFLMGGHG